jgi:hypothetical protein
VPGGGGSFALAAHFEQLEAERLDLGERPVQRRLVGQRSCQHSLGPISLRVQGKAPSSVWLGSPRTRIPWRMWVLIVVTERYSSWPISGADRLLGR